MIGCTVEFKSVYFFVRALIFRSRYSIDDVSSFNVDSTIAVGSHSAILTSVSRLLEQQSSKN